MATLLLVLQKAHQLLLLVAKISLTLTVKTLDIEPVAKKPCHSLYKIHQTSTSSKKRHYLKRWEIDFEWLEYDEDLQGTFCKYCKKWANASNKTGGTWVTKPFNNWKKAVAKMKEHTESEGHIHACQVETNNATSCEPEMLAFKVETKGIPTLSWKT